jgi:phosphoribosylglycinamide formyltransferase 1
MRKARLGILISGRGSNMQAIVTACAAGSVPAEVAIVVANQPRAEGLAWARERALPTALLSHRDYPDREAHDRAIVTILHAARVDLVCLAGYMRLLSRTFIDAFPTRILNIHPSLLPAFPGLHAQQQALDYGARVTGCTVHLVDAYLDHGPIVVQRTVEVRDEDTADSLSDRILEQEHEAYPAALRRLLETEWSLEGRKVVFPPAANDEEGRNPSLLSRAIPNWWRESPTRGD